MGEPPVSLEFHRGVITWTTSSTGNATLSSSMPFLADSNEIDIVREDGIRLPAKYLLDGDRLTLIHGQEQTGRPDSVEAINWPTIRIALRRVETNEDPIEWPEGVSP